MAIGRECQDLKPKFIIRRRDVPLSRTKWLFEERTINYGEVLNRRIRNVLLRITLDLAKLPPGRLKELITKGSYALHQWVWLLFTDDETRKFLFREEEGQGFLRFYVLSENAPTKNDLFQIETKEFKPKLRKGDRLIFL